jgi:hypothetical protein
LSAVGLSDDSMNPPRRVTTAAHPGRRRSQRPPAEGPRVLLCRPAWRSGTAKRARPGGRSLVEEVLA